MGRMASPGEDDCQVKLFGRSDGLRAGRSKNRADLEEPDIPLALAPVVLDPPDQTRQQPAAQMAFVR
jgi:hypothetical protein